VDIFDKAIKWVMLISGLLTSTALSLLFAPEASLRSVFGEPIASPLMLITVRHWGALVGLFGLMLIYGAFKESVRRMVLVAVSAGKLVFIILAFTQGLLMLPQARAGLVIDSISVLIFALYLIASRKQVAA
jgi:hypothetical protein